ncbi:transmembrane protein 154 isoform X2 [Xiphias gladius]|uniref:transmembrane protein 154 isoform X2 n=1 Tax=Xiphias gladius TaxID=8245 RepID=UPI001A988B2D|nr:transmembrane protein 154 isoform X2 [Xiphias gladius]
MSASPPGNMRGPRVKTPLLLLLLLTSLAGTETEAQEDVTGDPDPVDDDTEIPDPLATEDPGEQNTQEDHSSGLSYLTSSPWEVSPYTEDPNTMGSTITPLEVDQNVGLIIIPILVVLVVVIIGMIVCGIFINCRWNKTVRNQELRKEDPYLDESSTEKVPMPMFEEDVPSVLELEMEELDQWMKKDS